MANPTGKNTPFVKGNKIAVGNSGPPPKYTEEFIEEEAKALLKWIEGPRNLFLKMFAHERGYGPARMPEFAQKSKVFAEALERAKDKQEEKFVNGAWSKDMDMAFVKHFMPRMLRDRPEWKNSWDKEDDAKVVPTQVIIHKYVNDET